MAGVNINNEDFIIQNNDKFIIQRELNGKNIIFGTFTSLNEAIIEKDKLDENGWPIPIDETLNIKTQIDTAENQIINNTLEENPKIEEFYENEESEEFIEYDGEYYIIKKYVYNKIKIYGVFKNKSQAINKRNQLIHTDWLGPYAIQTNKYKYGENIIPHDYIFKIEKDINGKTQDFGSYKTFKEAVKARDELIKNKWKINDYTYPPFDILRINNFGTIETKNNDSLKLNINDILRLNDDYYNGASIGTLAVKYNIESDYIRRIIARYHAGDFKKPLRDMNKDNDKINNFSHDEYHLKRMQDTLNLKKLQIEESYLPEPEKYELKKFLKEKDKENPNNYYAFCNNFDKRFNKIAKKYIPSDKILYDTLPSDEILSGIFIDTTKFSKNDSLLITEKLNEIEQSNLSETKKYELKKYLFNLTNSKSFNINDINIKFNRKIEEIEKTYEKISSKHIISNIADYKKEINEKKLLIEISKLPEDKKVYLKNYITILTQSIPFNSSNFKYFFDEEFNEVIQEYQTKKDKSIELNSDKTEILQKNNITLKGRENEFDKLIFNVKVGKSYKNRGWSVIREETKSLVPLLPYEDSCDIIVDGIPAKAHFNLLPRIFLNNPEDKLRNHLKELHDQNPDDRINVELILNKENINDSNNKDLNHAINEIKRLNNKLEILSKENKKLKKELDKQKSR